MARVPVPTRRAGIGRHGFMVTACRPASGATRPARCGLSTGAGICRNIAAMLRDPSARRDVRVNALLGAGHFLSHFYQLCLPPLFIAWQHAFGVSFAELGLSVALMSGATAVAQTPVGILVDRYGARRFLIGGILLMGLSVAAMGLAAHYWQVVGLALLSGIGNSVLHPCDYAILSGSIRRERLGRSFSFHTFCGYIGYAAAPPVMATLLFACGWRAAVGLAGLVGVPVALAILWQSPILAEAAGGRETRAEAAGAGALLTRPLLLFGAFYMVAAMATAGIQSWLITVLHQVNGLALATASAALTGYMIGMMSGILLGGWAADRSGRLLLLAVGLSLVGAALLLAVGLVPMPEAATLGVLLGAGVMLGATRTPRDLMVKDAAGPGQVGKAFGFVSAGLSLGSAVMPVPYGMLIDAHRPDLVLVVVAGLLAASVVFAIGARAASVRELRVAAAQ